MVKAVVIAVLVVASIIGGLGYWAWRDTQEWERYKIQHGCVFSGETRTTMIEQWVSTGNGGGFFNPIPVTDSLFICVNSDGTKIKVWH